MRVCHIVTGDGWGGAERVVSLLLAGMAKREGLTVQVVLFNQGQLASTLARLGLDIHIIPEAGRSFLALCRELRQWVQTHQPDVVHVHRYKELAAAMVSSLPRVPPLVVTVHGLQPWDQLSWLEGIKNWAFMIMARFLDTYFVAVSTEIALRLGRVLGRARTIQIGNPLPPLSERGKGEDLRAKLNWHAMKGLVGFIGRLEFVKGPDLFLEIAERCGTDIGFIVIGGGAMEAGLRELSRAGGRMQGVSFLGQVADATPYLCQLDVLALTSRHEGLPMVVLEAAAYGVPVVAFDVGGVKEAVDGSRAARLISFGDMAGFAAAIQDIVGNKPDIQPSLSQWAQSVRSKFGSESVVERYVSVYNMAIGLGNPHSGSPPQTVASNTSRPERTS
jgi:glycosyltransferase involved in cell wall biosynthesis